MVFSPNDTLPGACSECSKGFGNLKSVYKVPVFDPSEAPEPMEASKLIGRYFHAACWYSHEAFSIVTPLVVKALASEFSSPEDEVFSSEGVAFWCNRHSNIAFQNGVLYLSCSSFIFQNIMGGDIEGSIVRGHKSELEALISFILNDGFRVGFSNGDETLRLKCMEELDDGFLIKVDSDSEDLQGYLYLSSIDRLALSSVAGK